METQIEQPVFSTEKHQGSDLLCDMEILKLIGTYRSKPGQINEKVLYLCTYPVRNEKIESENFNL